MKNFLGIGQGRKNSRSIPSFLKKTYELLNTQEHQDVIRWATNGIGFIVLNQTIFSREILPKYFRHNNYSSFVRQLNMYNFHKIRESNTESYFHHIGFDRSDKEKLTQIKRKPQKKKRKIQESDQEILSEVDQKEKINPISLIKIKQAQKNSEEQRKIEQQNNTNQYFSSECNSGKVSPIWKPASVDEQSEDRLSINNDISDRICPRLATREFFYPSTNNLFSFGVGSSSPFCFFF